jgi:PAS domain S-box-containing protein
MTNEDTISELKNKVINQALIVFSLMAIIPQALTFVRSAQLGIDIYVIMSTLNVFLLWILAFFRKKINLSYKIACLIGIIFIALTLGLKMAGFLASAKLYIAIIPIFLSFLLKYRYALLSLVLYLTIYLVFAFLYFTGILEHSFDLTAYANNVISWLIDSSILLVISWGLLHVGHNFSLSLQESNKKIQQQNIELADKEEKYRKLFEDATDAIMLLDKNGIFFDYNQATCEYFQVSKTDMLGKSPIDYSPEFQPDNEKSADKAMRLIESSFNNLPQHFEWQHLTSKGDYFMVAISLNKIELSGELYVQAILRDITEQKRKDLELSMYRDNLEKMVQEKTNDLESAYKELKTINEELYKKNEIIHHQNDELTHTLSSLKETQTQLLQAEKMASLGTLTAGIAHEINNPLNYLLGAYYGLSNYFSDYGSQNEKLTTVLLNSIKQGVERTSDIVQGLNQFSRDNSSYEEDCNIHSILNNCLAMLYNQLKNNIEVVKNYHNEQIVVKGNVGKLHQAFINILSNSVHAIKTTGTIEIITKTENENAIIVLSDTGHGISQKHMNRITDPFFTTKPPGEGTGLGLSITYAIIKEHKGIIDFESEPNKGTTVTVKMPQKKQ